MVVDCGVVVDENIHVSKHFLERVRLAASKSLIGFHQDFARQWILLHERAHLDLGHFSILKGVPTFNLISKFGKSQVEEPDLPRDLWDKVERCLELQADHEALEEMLGNVDEVDWAELRVTIASIASVMRAD